MVTNLVRNIIPVCMLVFFMTTQTLAAIHYVKEGGSGGGTSWTDASGDLQAIINAAVAGDQIWVAAGTYKPTTGTNRFISFTMRNGVAIYGGFPNMGNPGFNDRNPDPASNGTVLSGEIGATGNGDNSLHVISNSFSAGNPLTSTAVLDGFTVTGGYANDNFNPHSNGGGMYNSFSSPTVTNCNFSGNSANRLGGAVYNLGNGGISSPSFTNCNFSGNSATSFSSGGGAVNNEGRNGGVASPSFTNCTFSSNSANNSAGAVFNYGFNGISSPSFVDCTFSSNSATAFGGAIYNQGYGSGTASPSFTNCSFSGNFAKSTTNSGSFGGAMYNYGFIGGTASPNFANCSFSGNSSESGGGAIHNYGYVSGGTASPNFTNCSFFGNSSNFGGALFNNADISGMSSPNFTNCTFANNLANRGGAINNNARNSSTANLSFINCSFSGNSAFFGGAMSNDSYISTFNVNMANCILWGNTASNGPVFYYFNSTTLNINYSLVQGANCAALGSGTSCGAGMIYNQNPSFFNQANGDLQLQYCSPAIDVGNDSANNEPLDLGGFNRKYDAIPGGSLIDMGAYERQPPLIPIAKCKSAPTAELGSNGIVTVYPADIDNGSSGCGTLLFTINGQPSITYTCAQVGISQTVILLVSDIYGSDNCTTSVAVEDNMAPNAICPTIPNVVLDANGNGTLPANIGIGSSTDNCTATETSPSANFTCTDIGVQTVTLTASDGTNGSTVNCSFNVVDNVSPLAVCPTTIADVVLDANGNGTLPANIGNGSSSDNCTATETSPSANFTCADVGVQTVTLTVSDGTNSSTVNCSFNVVDNAAPLAVCPATIADVVLDSIGNGTLPANIGDGSSSDNCGTPTETSPSASFTCADLGAQTVTLTATDGSGNLSSTNCSFNVVDNKQPNANCKNTTVLLDNDGKWSVGGGDINDNSSDECGIASYLINGQQFVEYTCTDVGANTAVLTVIDLGGNSSTCTATVTVEDNEPPVPVCKTTTVQLDAAGNHTLTQNDVYGGDTDNCTIVNFWKMTPTAVDCSQAGTTVPVLVEVFDASGNQASCTANVTVEDAEAPAAVCPTNIPDVVLGPNGFGSLPANIGDGSSTDNCSATETSPAMTFNCNAGTQMVTLTVTDGTNTLTTNCAFNVVDNQAPVAHCPANIPDVLLDANGNGSLPANIGDGSSTDNCSATETSPTASFTCADVGTQTVTLTADDGTATATATCNFNVVDNTNPDAQCTTQTINATLDVNAQYTVDPNDLDNGSSDACGPLALTASPPLLDCGDEGANTVTLTVTDNNGNSSTCTATVEVAEFLTVTGISHTDETCAGAGDGTITITATAGGGQVKYSIDGGVNFSGSGAFANLTPGNYDIVVKVFGIPAICEKTDVATVAAGPAPSTWYRDADADGYTDGTTYNGCVPPAGYVPSATPGDCNDGNATVHPNAPELCDGLDNDCDGVVPANEADSDGDGYMVCDDDCDDNNASVNPGATEICDGLDNDCDGGVDEGLSGETYSGSVTFSTQQQIDDWPACYGTIDGSLSILGGGITNLGPLANITEVTGSVSIYYNVSLASLGGLDNLATVGGSFTMFYNFALGDCCAIYGLLDGGGVTGSVVIFFNAVGCNSQSEILSECAPAPFTGGGGNGAISFDDGTATTGIAVYPNPASGVFTVLVPEDFADGRVSVSDINGRQILVRDIEKGVVNYRFDSHLLVPGIYMIIVKADGQPAQVERLVVE